MVDCEDKCAICNKECSSQIDMIECETRHKDRYDRFYEEYMTKLYKEKLKIAAENQEQQKLSTWKKQSKLKLEHGPY